MKENKEKKGKMYTWWVGSVIKGFKLHRYVRITGTESVDITLTQRPEEEEGCNKCHGRTMCVILTVLKFKHIVILWLVLHIFLICIIFINTYIVGLYCLVAVWLLGIHCKVMGVCIYMSLVSSSWLTGGTP